MANSEPSNSNCPDCRGSGNYRFGRHGACPRCEGRAGIEKDKRTPGDKALDALLQLANDFEAWSIDDTTLEEGRDWRDAAHKARQAADAVARATANWKKKEHGQ